MAKKRVIVRQKKVESSKKFNLLEYEVGINIKNVMLPFNQGQKTVELSSSFG
jgi:hypothetical protein